MSDKIVNVMSVIDYIEENLCQKLDLEAVSNAAHYSKYHLHRVFAATTGVTLHDYIQRRKLTEAARLLVFSDRPILEIAFIAGYESQQAFSSVFKQMYKKTPKQYREKAEFYPLQLRYRLIREPGKAEEKTDWLKEMSFASFEDIPQCLNLVRMAVDGFPNLKEAEYSESISSYIGKRQALILKDGETAVGLMAFEQRAGRIDFLGVHPQYRGAGITKAFLNWMKKDFGSKEDQSISITTFRKGDRADPGHRKKLESLGFTEGELLVEFGYPTQRMILQVM